MVHGWYSHLFISGAHDKTTNSNIHRNRRTQTTSKQPHAADWHLVWRFGIYIYWEMRWKLKLRRRDGRDVMFKSFYSIIYGLPLNWLSFVILSFWFHLAACLSCIQYSTSYTVGPQYITDWLTYKDELLLLVGGIVETKRHSHWDWVSDLLVKRLDLVSS